MDSLPSVSLHPQSSLQLVLCAFALYLVAGAFYRLYLSPLAKFPGPKLTALTYWVEFYYDLLQGGRFQVTIGEMHKQYGKMISASLPRYMLMSDRTNHKGQSE